MIRKTALPVIIAITAALSGCTEQRLDAFVYELRAFPPALGPQMRSNGEPIEAEVARSRLYAQLHIYGEEGVLALGRGLHHEDVQVRRNATLALLAFSFGFYPWGDIRKLIVDMSINVGEGPEHLRFRTVIERRSAAW